MGELNFNLLPWKYIENSGNLINNVNNSYVTMRLIKMWLYLKFDIVLRHHWRFQ